SVAFADSSFFVLPTHFVVTAAIRGGEETRNTVHLRNCHKFRAQSRIVPDSGTDSGSNIPGSSAAPQIPPTVTSLLGDLNESATIFAALGQQALQDDEIRLQDERKQMLDAATASALERLSALRSEQSQVQARLEATATSMADVAARQSVATLEANVNLVPVSVVIRDANGRAVGNLGQQNFRLFDNGKPQVITHFSIETSAGLSSRGSPAQPSGTAPVPVQGPVTPVATPSSAAAAERATAYLFDDVHLNSGDLASAREAAARHLGSLQAEERAGIFTTSGAVTVDFTNDREKLLEGLHKLKPRAKMPQSECPRISHYMADLMVNKHDPEANEAAVAEVQNCSLRSYGFSGPEARREAAHTALEVLNTGNTESKNALAVLGRVVRTTEALPGQRSIVLVSPGFLALTSDMEADLMDIVDGALHSGIVINTLDAHGLYTAGFSANSTPGNLEFDQAEARARGDVMTELASGTGGTFFHNNSNLDEGFRRTADAPELVYILGFSPQKLDGKFHELKVTLNGAARFDVQSRRGYYALKPASAK
ncbi:MAG: VWA domain-containing protein, partial [Terriglobales bacterium]